MADETTFTSEEDEDVKMIEDARKQLAEEEAKNFESEEMVPEEEPEEEPKKDEPLDIFALSTNIEDAELAVDELPKEEREKLFQEETVDATPNDDVPDLSEVLHLTTASLEELEECLKDEDMSQEALEKAISTDSKLAKIAKAYHLITKAVQLQGYFLGEGNIKPVADLISDKTTRGEEFSKVETLAGNSAIVNVAARLNKIQKVYLYNSGFHIDLRKLSVNEIRNILESIDDEGKEIGRTLGGHFYVMNDIFYIQQIAGRLKDIVVGSNLANWDHGTTLIKHISFNDFDSILGAMGHHLFSKGVKYTLECPSCNYSEKITLDLNQIKTYDINKMPQEAIERLLNPDTFKSKDFFKYQQAIGAYRNFKFSYDGEQGELHMKVPTIMSFLKHGIRLVSYMLRELYGDDDSTPSDQQIFDYRVLNYYKNFLPWIEQLVWLDKDGKPSFKTSEIKALEQVLEPNIWENNPEKEQFLSFIKDTRLTHHGVLGNVCKKCHRAPNPKTNGYIPLDMHAFFYNLSVFYQLRSMRS